MSIEIPDKTWFKIGEVARIVGVKPYVIRYWESEFRALRPAKTKSRQRLFRQRDIELLMLIRRLLHEEKFTIDGARKQLKEMTSAGLSPSDVLEAELAGMDVGLTTVQRMALREHGPAGEGADVLGADDESPAPQEAAASPGRPGTLPLPLGNPGEPPVEAGGPAPPLEAESPEPPVAANAPPPAQDAEVDVAGLLAQVDALRGEVEALQEQLAYANRERERLAARLRSLVESSRRRWREVRRLISVSDQGR